MASALGKRKRRDQINDFDANNASILHEDSANMQALFRQHFESAFEPLPGTFARSHLDHDIDSEPSEREPEPDWDGFSDHSEEHAETVNHATHASSKGGISKDEYKTFMVRAQIVIVYEITLRLTLYCDRVQSLRLRLSI